MSTDVSSSCARIRSAADAGAVAQHGDHEPHLLPLRVLGEPAAAPRPRPAACPARPPAAPSAARRPAPCRAPRPARRCRPSSSSRRGVRGQIALVHRGQVAGRRRRRGRARPASCGSRRSRSAVSTSANRWGGWSQPAAADMPLDVEGQRSSRELAAGASLMRSILPCRATRAWELPPRVGKLTGHDAYRRGSGLRHRRTERPRELRHAGPPQARPARRSRRRDADVAGRCCPRWSSSGVLLIAFSIFTGFYTDLLWYQSVGYTVGLHARR